MSIHAKRTWERGPVRSVLVSTMRDDEQMRQVVEKHLASRPDAVLLELEAGIVANHDAARRAVSQVLHRDDYDGILRAIKINPVGSEHLGPDLEAVGPGRPDAIMMTLVKDPSEVRIMADLLAEVEREHGYPDGDLRIWILVERARGVVRLPDIVEASDRVDLVCFGPADLTADLGTAISLGREDLGPYAGVELEFGRGMTVYAAKAAGVLAIDTALTNVRADNGMHARVARQMGYDGMVAISPRQIPEIEAEFTPGDAEIAHAQRAVDLFHEGASQGIGIANLDGEMISKSVYEGYLKVLARAGIIVQNILESGEEA